MKIKLSCCKDSPLSRSHPIAVRYAWQYAQEEKLTERSERAN
ncbi:MULTISPECIES: hypothetical protein [unclassified Sphingobacterium]|nr:MULTISPECIES: hypothetical protein [unclassified Sphingobacterium]